MVVVARKHAECIAEDAVQAEFDRCISLAKLPANSTSHQQCEYVLYTACLQNGDTILTVVSLSNLNRLSKLFHWLIFW